MRMLLLVAACSAAFGAALDPAEIVRRAVANDEDAHAGAALAYDFTEQQKTQHLDDAGKVRSVTERTRDIHMPDYLVRRDRYRKAIREIPDAFCRIQCSQNGHGGENGWRGGARNCRNARADEHSRA